MNKFKAYLKIINEELIKQFNYKGHYVEVYKNPKSLKKMQAWIRGVIRPSGDLFIFDIEDVSVDKNAIIHSDVVQWMRRNIIGFNSTYKELDNPLDYINEFITVDRSGITNTFVLAESYDLSEVEEFENEINNYIENFKKKNPGLELVIFADEIE
jgi:hypothetical protein